MKKIDDKKIKGLSIMIENTYVINYPTYYEME